MKMPPLLLAAGLIFWGWQTGQWIPAILLALVLEGPRILPTRFELSTLEFHRIWILCFIVFVALVFYLAINQEGPGTVVFPLLNWVPFIFVLVPAAQLYSAGGKIPALAFKTFYKEEKDTSDPRTAKTVDVQYPYFALCVLAASAAVENSGGFFGGLCLLFFWAFAGFRSQRFSRVSWAAMLGLAMLLGFWGSKGFYETQKYVDSQVIDWITKRLRGDQDPFKSRTAIGTIAELKLHDTILFHVDYEKGHMKKILLPQSVYNIYKNSTWYATQSKFSPLTSPSGTDWRFEKNLVPEKIIKVSMNLHKGRGLLMVPNQAFRMEDLPVGRLQHSQFGAVKVEGGPEFVSYKIGIHPEASRNGPPEERDLKVPEALQPVLQKIADDHQLASLTPAEILRTLDNYFQKNFSYSLSLEGGPGNVPPLEHFFTHTRAGHCEYFASAAVLLLRQAGIPARYVFGYSVHEYNWLQKNLVARSRDAHSWALAYVDGRWQNFDTTPSGWIDEQTEGASSLEFLSDLWSQVGFLFAHFRWGMQEEGDRNILFWLLLPPLLFLVWRIYSRTRLAQQRTADDGPATLRFQDFKTDFLLIENQLNTMGFAREEWETYSHWLRRIRRDNPEAPVDALGEAVALHDRKRFDPNGLNSAEETRLKTEIQAWLQASS